jgi:hypothetical protein
MMLLSLTSRCTQRAKNNSANAEHISDSALVSYTTELTNKYIFERFDGIRQTGRVGERFTDISVNDAVMLFDFVVAGGGR